MSKLALRAQTIDIAALPLRQDALAKIGSMNRSKTFRFGQHPVNARLIANLFPKLLNVVRKTGFLKELKCHEYSVRSFVDREGDMTLAIGKMT
jgi:hypothetical protein